MPKNVMDAGKTRQSPTKKMIFMCTTGAHFKADVTTALPGAIVFEQPFGANPDTETQEISPRIHETFRPASRTPQTQAYPFRRANPMA